MLPQTPRSGTLASFNYVDPLLPVKSWVCMDYITLETTIRTKSKNTSILRFLKTILKRKHLIAYYNQQC